MQQPVDGSFETTATQCICVRIRVAQLVSFVQHCHRRFPFRDLNEMPMILLLGLLPCVLGRLRLVAICKWTLLGTIRRHLSSSYACAPCAVRGDYKCAESIRVPRVVDVCVRFHGILRSIGDGSEGPAIAFESICASNLQSRGSLEDRRLNRE